MNLPQLKINNLKPEFPIIQGGMAVKVSNHRLAAAVANEGGVGVIAASAISANELKEEIRKARKLTNGIIGVNIMFAVNNFKELANAAIEEDIDLIISGAGFSRDIFGWCKKANIPFIPIVSSLKLAKISERLGATAIIVEGGNAGGHLGTDKDSWEILQDIVNNINIPIIGAGGVINKKDMEKMFALGVNGVQMGSRFLATEESNVADNFKEMVVNLKREDIVTIISSVGLPANAIRTPLVEKILKNIPPKPKKCIKCLKACSHSFCIFTALNKAREGDYENGLFFVGKEAWRINEILTVKEVFKDLFS